MVSGIKGTSKGARGVAHEVMLTPCVTSAGHGTHACDPCVWGVETVGDHFQLFKEF